MLSSRLAKHIFILFSRGLVTVVIIIRIINLSDRDIKCAHCIDQKYIHIFELLSEQCNGNNLEMEMQRSVQMKVIVSFHTIRLYLHELNLINFIQ